MNHNNSSRFNSFAFASGGIAGSGGARGELSSGNLSRTLSSPMAESTQLDSSGIRGNLYGSPVRQVGVVKRKPTSPLQNSRTNFRSSGNLTTSGFGVGRLIDSQTYTDAQSRGLVNRLVKYHDKVQSPLNRSQSMTNLYSKPGQFPVVHLKKTEIKYSPRRNNTSITSVRIAPPEKSVFQANTRSNILRAGSLLIPAEPHLKMARTQQHGNEIDAENRVIAPTAELEPAPTRSVLDALKEISRKRINNEELDADRIKKQCKELSEVDSGGAGTKRTREMTSSTSPPSRGTTDQQLQKKRLCSKNNDISSSLSSSLVMNTPKRMEPVMPRPGRLNVDQSFSTPAAFNATAPVNIVESLEPVKLNRIDSAPLPQIARIVPEIQTPVPVRPQPKQPKLTLFNKKYDETIVRPASTDSEDQDDDDELGGRISFIKPKDKSPILSSDRIALKQVERSKLSMILSCLSDDYDKDGEPPKSVALQTSFFAKDAVDAPAPKAQEKTNESISVPKLSGISALMNSPIKDPGLGKIDPSKPVEKASLIEKPKSSIGFAFGATTAATNLAPNAAKQSDTSFAFGTPTKPIATEEKLSGNAAGGFTFGTSAAPVAKTDPPPAYSFPTAITTSSSAPIKPNSMVTISTSSQAATPAPATTNDLISFSPAPLAKSQNESSGFSTPAALSTSTSATTQPTTTFGSGFSAFKPAATAAQSTTVTVTTSVTSLPTFGNPTPATSATNNVGFSFGTSAPKPATPPAVGFNVATSKPPTAAVAPTTAVPSSTATNETPSFGAFAAKPATTTVASFGTPTTATPAFGFSATASSASSGSINALGGFGTNSSAATTTATNFGTTVTPSNASSNIFGSSAATAPAKTEAPSFGQSNLNSTFSFSATSATATAAAPNPSIFSFGVAPSNAVTSAPSNMFGNSNNNSNSNNNNNNNSAPTFGGIKSNAVPSFGSSPASSGQNVQPSPFGTASTTINSAAPAFGTSSSGFGAAPTFGANSTPNSSSVFGNVSNVAPNASPFGSTGASSNSAGGGIFGSAIASNNNSNNTNNNQSTSTGGPFTFGGSSVAASATTSSTNKPFSFGGANNAIGNSSVPTANPIKSNSFSFAAGSNANAHQSTAPTGAVPNASFSFAGASNMNNNAAPSQPTFGGTNSAFSFASNTISNNNVNSNNNNNNNSNTNQATVKPFSFGGATNNPQPTPVAPAVGGGIFGGVASIPTATSPPAFNFSAGSNPPSSGGAFSFNSPNSVPVAAAGGPFSMSNGAGVMGPAAGAPMFSIGTGGGTQPRRTIKLATRRHK
ncbi:uncharacterized protein LOC131430233 [Malaya genurostris]|uniref:uncharacterized protein LOC131430233 n=1 Tax=Malaya genurostris TaxID=325434 RepID=UPI0026F39416|nr:uncharacterized protein LOC131430233 [Malaya genurostris]